ncbi:DUF167 domain-containing protein [Candidatus Dependentiae bacterium]|nr:DUF167 domain-containing protein [Candidatus Dependentiae bacterium]
MLEITEKEDSIIIPVKVIPKSSRENIKIENDILKIKVTAAPVDGKANKSVINYISKFLHIPKRSVQIISGLTSRKKILVLRGISKEDLIKKINHP